MKITLEPAKGRETEVIIRGDVGSAEVAALLQFLGRKNSGKLLVYKEDEQYIVDAGEIVFVETSGSRVNVYTRSETYEAKLKLYELLELLEGFSMVQINKSTMVNMDYVKSIQAEFSGNYLLKLKNRKEVLVISRKFFKGFKESI